MELIFKFCYKYIKIFIKIKKIILLINNIVHLIIYFNKFYNNNKNLYY